MNKLPQKKNIDSALKRVCNHPKFSKSQRNVALLRYLVEKAIQGSDVKEQVIGIELFDENYVQDQNSGFVRIYIYNLRKRLKEYYLADGANEPLRFEIKKGQYNLTFTTPLAPSAAEVPAPVSNSEHLHFSVSKRVLYGLGIALFVLLSVGIYASLPKTQYCWSAFMAKDANNICVMADQMIFHQKQASGIYPIIIKDINSESDFIKYLDQHNTDSVRLADYTLFSKMAPYSIQRLTQWFSQQGSSFSLRLETKFEIDELRNSNVIFIGQSKTMNTSRAIFLKNSKCFKKNPLSHGYIVKGKSKELRYRSSRKDNIRTEYAMVSYFELETGQKALYFVSNNDIGTMATVNNFTNPVWLQKFYEQLPAPTSYFNALFKVSGTRRTETASELVELEVVEAQ